MNNQLENRKNRARKHPKAETAQEKNTEQEKAPAAGKRRKEKIADFTADYRDAFAERPAVSSTEDDATEIDDFYPDADEDDALLTKWAPEEEEAEIPSLPERPARKKGRRRYGVVVGSLVLLLALVGVVFIAGTIGNRIYTTVTDDSQLRAYDTFLTPVVMQDPAPFESIEEANEDFILNASLWKTITANNGTNYTEYDEAGRALVPLGDVVDACRALFGPDCQLQPKTPAEETFFEYDSVQNEFHVALYSSDSSYTPYTESERRSGGKVYLRVGYVSPSDEWRNQTSSTLEGPTPTKYMEYELTQDPSTQEYYISAIRSLEEEQ